MITQHHRILGILVVACLGGLVQPVVAAVQYSVTDLGASEGGASGINNAGEVAGYTQMPDGSYQAFLWTAGQMTMLGKLVGNTYGGSLNDQGQVVGRAAAGTGNADLRAVLWQNGTVQDLNTGVGPTLTVSWGINNAGQILVGSTTSAYLLDGDTLLSLGFEHGAGLNENGQVAGTRNTGQYDANGAIGHAVSWSNGTVLDLGTLGGKRSAAYDINNNGLIVGAADTAPAPGSPDLACYWDALGIHSIPLSGTRSQAYGVNDLGQIVGIYSPDTDPQYGHAFLYAGGLAQDLNNLIDPLSGWLLLRGWDINNAGSIIGEGLFQGQKRSYLLTPVPLPATAVLLLPGLLWIRRGIRR